LFISSVSTINSFHLLKAIFLHILRTSKIWNKNRFPFHPSSILKRSSVQRAGIVQSVQQLATGWMTRGSEFESRAGQEFSPLHIIQTSSGVHPSSYPMGTGGSFPRGKATRAWSWPLTSNKCRGQENVSLLSVVLN
jgi:hypothetical protein